MIDIIGIYMIKNKTTNKVYIGQSIDINNRWIRHKSELNNNKHTNSHLQHAWNKYGESDFLFEIIKECEEYELNDLEVFYIQQYDSINTGYNLCEGGNGIRGYKHSIEEIEKMRMVQNPKTILQIDKNLNIVSKWFGSSHIEKTLSYSRRNIEQCCNMKYGHKTAYGYFWFYEDDYNNHNIDWDYYLSERKTEKEGKHIVQKDDYGNIISIFSSIMEAHRVTKINRQGIQYCLQGKQKKTKGFIFEYI